MAEVFGDEHVRRGLGCEREGTQISHTAFVRAAIAATAARVMVGVASVFAAEVLGAERLNFQKIRLRDASPGD